MSQKTGVCFTAFISSYQKPYPMENTPNHNYVQPADLAMHLQRKAASEQALPTQVCPLERTRHLSLVFVPFSAELRCARVSAREKRISCQFHFCAAYCAPFSSLSCLSSGCRCMTALSFTCGMRSVNGKNNSIQMDIRGFSYTELRLLQVS